ncbi:MAG: ACP S-malonyltransferase [Clostridiales bacterium]|nr:ACP S-malonyltransferase [Clostridiales bacterium]
MGKIAFVFSGQGAQHPGMGKEFYENNKSVQSLFDQAEKIRPGTLATMFEGDAAALCATENTQPCLYLADLAPAIVLSEAGIHPAGAAGFSLGELPALAFAGAMNLSDGFSLTVKRGEYMGAATKEQKTAMAAVVKLDNETVEKICAEFDAVYPVNYNAPGQLSVAGDAEQMKTFSERIKAEGGLAIPLKVAGGFHSPFMDTAAAHFADVLTKTPFAAPSIPVYANYTAKPYQAPIADTLREQMNHPVLWERTIRQMAEDGFDTFIETGVGNVLTKLIAKIVPECRVLTAQSVEDCANIAEEVASHA